MIVFDIYRVPNRLPAGSGITVARGFCYVALEPSRPEHLDRLTSHNTRMLYIDGSNWMQRMLKRRYYGYR